MQVTISRTTMIVLIACALVTAGALTFGIASGARAANVSVLPVTSQQTGIAVCGHGTAKIKPDQAKLQVGVNATAGNAQDARTQAAQAMADVVAALKSSGVAADDIQTNYFSIQPQYDYSGGKQRQTGYVASNSVSATIRKVDSAGSVADAVTRAGGNRVFVAGIQFSNGDSTAAQVDAQGKAIADARRQAAQIAQSAGVSLAAPVSIQVGACGTTSPGPVFAGAQNSSAKDSGASTPIQPGQNEVAVEVAVIYAIH
jgi:uncharacterized protein YggE